jgi:hypothetical protein
MIGSGSGNRGGGESGEEEQCFQAHEFMTLCDDPCAHRPHA